MSDSSLIPSHPIENMKGLPNLKILLKHSKNIIFHYFFSRDLSFRLDLTHYFSRNFHFITSDLIKDV